MKRQNLRTVSLIVVTFTYLLIGAAIFGWLESEHEIRQREHLDRIEQIIREKYNISEDDFTVLTTTVIKSVPHKAGIQWKFPGAFYFATTVVTTIGYGHSTPSTTWGRSFCMVYALIGIPLGLVMFQSIGERLNTFVGSALRHAKRCFKARNPEVTQTNLVMVVSVLSTILMTSMAAVFAKYERWDYFDALYYCFITLTTIGFGDYVALQKESALQSKPEYVALSLIFILFGLSVVSSAVNLLVLKFLTLNTEDERRDEQLRYTAAMNPIQLEGDVITSSAGGLEYARKKRPALTMSQAMARSSMGRDRQRRALVSAQLARSRPVLALKHSKLDLTQPVMTNQRQHHLRSSGSSARSTDSSTRLPRAPQPDEIHIQNARHRAEDDEMRQVVGWRRRRQRRPDDCDELECDDEPAEMRRRRPLAITGGGNGGVEEEKPWQMCHTTNKRQRVRRANDDKNGHESDDEEEDAEEDDEDDEEDEDGSEEEDDNNDHQYCHFHNQNNNSKLSADDGLCAYAHERPSSCHVAHAGRRHHHNHDRNNNNNNDGASVRYCPHNERSPFKCIQQQQMRHQSHIVYVPSSQSFNEVHHHHYQRPSAHYYPRGSLQSQSQSQSQCHASRGYAPDGASQNQLIPLELEQAPNLSIQLANIRANTTTTATTNSRRRPPDDGDASANAHADDEDHAPPVVELLMSAQSLDEHHDRSPLVAPNLTGQVFTYPDPAGDLARDINPQALLMNRQLRAANQAPCSVSTLQLAQRYRHERLRSDTSSAHAPPLDEVEAAAHMSPVHYAPPSGAYELVRQTSGDGDFSYCNQATGHCHHHHHHREPHHAHHRRPLRRKIAPSQLGAARLPNQSSCSCSWASLSAFVSPEMTIVGPPARHRDLPLNRHTPTHSFHPALTGANTTNNSNTQTTSRNHSPTAIGRERSYDCVERRAKQNHCRLLSSHFQSSPAVYETDHHDERRSFTDDDDDDNGRAAISTSLQSSPRQPKSPTSTFDGGHPASRPDRARTKSYQPIGSIDSKLIGAELPATVSTSTRRPTATRRRRSNENAVPRLVCKCCCQHAECLEYALTSEATKQPEQDGPNVISMQGNNKDEQTAARKGGADCDDRNPSELAASVDVEDADTPASGGGGLIPNDQIQDVVDPGDKMIPDQPTNTNEGATINLVASTSEMGQQQEGGTSSNQR